MASPYLYIASQIHSGLSGLKQHLVPGTATASPYAQGIQGERLPTSLGEALAALESDTALRAAFGAPLINLYSRIKRSELERHAAAADPDEWMRREYFSRF